MEKRELALTLTLSLSLILVIAQFTAAKESLYLERHNRARRNVNGIGPVKWNDRLADAAGVMAAACGRPVRSRFGVNTYLGSFFLFPAHIIKRWIAEKRCYVHESRSCMPDCECKHYRQIIWNETRLIGCGRTKCQNNTASTVCMYSPGAGSSVEEYII